MISISGNKDIIKDRDDPTQDKVKFYCPICKKEETYIGDYEMIKNHLRSSQLCHMGAHTVTTNLFDTYIVKSSRIHGVITP